MCAMGLSIGSTCDATNTCHQPVVNDDDSVIAARWMVRACALCTSHGALTALDYCVSVSVISDARPRMSSRAALVPCVGLR